VNIADGRTARAGLDPALTPPGAASAVTANLRDALVRHRRAMGELNTALGLRLLP